MAGTAASGKMGGNEKYRKIWWKRYWFPSSIGFKSNTNNNGNGWKLRIFS
jgi:hypothetical protein